MKSSDILKWFNRIFYFICFPLICLSAILVPLTNDLRIYIGVEYIADKYYSLPQGWDLAWEIKPMANRIWNWMLYKVATLFVSFNDQVLFGIAVKITMLAVIIAVCWYFARQIKNPYAFPLTFCCMACLANFCIGQAEYWAVLFSLLVIGLMVQGFESELFPYIAYWIAGMLFVVIALFKGVTGLLLIPIICGAILLQKDYGWEKFWQYFLFLAGGFVFACIGFLSLCLTIWPNAIPDMLMSAEVARVGSYPGWVYLLSEVGYFYSMIVYMPILIFVIFFAMLYFLKIVHRNTRDAFLFAGMWIVPFVIVFLQGEFFVYQYLVLMIPAIVTVFLWDQT